MTRYSFIYPIRNRAALLKRGLESLVAMDYDKDKFEVVIADYLSEDNISEVVHNFRGKLNMQYLCIDYRRYRYYKIPFPQGRCNPALAQNVAAQEADGKFLILTSPEIVHWNQNLNQLDAMQDLEKKFIYGRVVEKSESEVFSLQYPFEAVDKMDSPTVLCDWENQLRSPVLYFVGVIPRDIYMKYGGIDEFYMSAIAYDDEDFGNRMQACGELSLEYSRKVCGVHLTHDRAYQDVSNIVVNREYCDNKRKEGWQHHLVANRNIKMADPDVLIERSQFWRY